MKPRAASLMALLALFALAPARADVVFNAEVDRATLTMDDTLVLSLVISGDRINVGRPELPPLPGFEVISTNQSQNFSFVNGQISSRLVYSYGLAPRAPGEHTIPAFTLSLEGRSLATQPIAVKVLPGGAPLSGGGPAPSAGPAPAGQGRPLFVDTRVDKTAPYVGEPMVLRFRFYNRARLLAQPSYQAPDTTGFLSQDLPPQRQYTQTVGGAPYSVTELATALFPTAPGEYTIGPASLQCQVPGGGAGGFGSFFDEFFDRGRPVTLRSDPISVKVKSLPEEGRPAGFQGDVGRYRIDARLDKTEVSLREPVTLTLVLSGEGNVKALSTPPLPRLEGFKIYETITQVDVKTDEDKVTGSKTFQTVLKPEISGPLSVPPVAFSYFDPSARAYRTIHSAPLTLRVAPGGAAAAPGLDAGGPDGAAAQGVKVVGRDIRHIKGLEGLRLRRKPFHDGPAFLALQALPGLVFLSIWAGRAARRRALADPHSRAFRRARAKAGRSLEGAGRAMSGGDLPGAYALMHRALLEFLTDKLGLPAQGLTWDALAGALADVLPEEGRARLQDLRQDLDLARFTPARLAPDQARGHIEALERLIKEMDGQWRK